MDKKDKKIIKCLKDDARASTQEISKKTMIPITTVYNRIKKMIESGIIKNYTVVLDQDKIGKSLPAYVLITVDKEELKEGSFDYDQLARQIKNMPEVEEALSITGVYDLMLKARLENVSQLNEFLVKLRKVQGIEKTQTGVILSEH